MSATLQTRLAVAQVMWLSLLRDRGALVMVFVLPVLVFSIFASIFSAAAGGDIDISVVLLDERDSPQSRRLVQALDAVPSVHLQAPPPVSRDAARALVRDGSADVGLIIRAGERPLDDPQAGPMLELLTEPTRDIAAALLAGAVNEAFVSAVPEALLHAVIDEAHPRLVRLDEAQLGRLDRNLGIMRKLERPPPRRNAGPVLIRTPVVESRGSPISVAYYAAAVAIMFGLFSAMNGAIGLIDERRSGLLARLAVGPGGVAAVVDGKAAFLALQGVVQMTIIFAVAALGFGVEVMDSAAPWLLVTVLTAFAATGLALGFVSLCRTRQQAQNLGNFLILILSAIGGSMVPRFMMPEFIQQAGWLTPHTWVLEAYAAVLWRGDGLAGALMPLTALAVSGVIGLGVARRMAGRPT